MRGVGRDCRRRLHKCLPNARDSCVMKPSGTFSCGSFPDLVGSEIGMYFVTPVCVFGLLFFFFFVASTLQNVIGLAIKDVRV